MKMQNEEETTKISMNFPRLLLDKLDERAKKMRLNRTQYIVKALETFLEVIK
ncbi:MAG: hypothetical protein ACFFA0_03735 [Promethearchaeota archaeon]